MATTLTSIRMSDVLGVEDDAALLAPICPHSGIPLWALLRTAFLRQLLSTLIYNSAPIGIAPTRPSRGAMLRTLARSVARNVLTTGMRGDICFMTTSLGLISRDGRQFDRLTGHFVDCTPQRAFAWEDQYDWRWIQDRAFERVRFHAPLQMAGAMAGRLKARSTGQEQARALVDAASRRARDLLGLTLDDATLAGLAASLARRAASVPYLFDAYTRELRRRRVRLLFKEDGCYGSSAIVLAAANASGIVTAEFQHGALSRAHDAYNVAPALVDSPAYRATLPQHFLGYGQWWNDQMNVPLRKHAVGNPHREETLRARGTSDAARETLLVLGDGIETDRYLDFVREVAPAARARGLRTVFRPHPLERPRLAHVAVDGFTTDTRSDIYDAFSEAAIVVSEISTGLFEAIGLVDHIVIWNTPKAVFNFPEHPFQAVDDAGQLAEALRSDGLRRIGQDQAHDVWAPSWRTNYLAFLSATLDDAPLMQEQPA